MIRETDGLSVKVSEREKTMVDPAARRVARGLAVQAVYQAIFTQTPPGAVAQEFARHRLPVLDDSESCVLPTPEDDLFYRLVGGVEEHLSDIDQMIASYLPDERPIERQLPLLLAILRCGLAEFLVCPQTPTAVIIDEYVDIAGGFFSQREPTFINAALDHLARVARPVLDDQSAN